MIRTSVMRLSTITNCFRSKALKLVTTTLRFPTFPNSYFHISSPHAPATIHPWTFFRQQKACCSYNINFPHRFAFQLQIWQFFSIVMLFESKQQSALPGVMIVAPPATRQLFIQFDDIGLYKPFIYSGTLVGQCVACVQLAGADVQNWSSTLQHVHVDAARLILIKPHWMHITGRGFDCVRKNHPIYPP